VFCVSLDHFGFVLSKLVLFGSVYSVRSQEIGWEERLQNDLFCIEWEPMGGKPFCLQCFDTVGWVSGRASGL